MKLNGRLTLGENNGGQQGGAAIALSGSGSGLIAQDKTGKEGRTIDGYTPESSASSSDSRRVWCEKRAIREVAKIDCEC